MTTETLKEIVDRLVGPIEPVGESNADGIRLKNLKNYNDLIYAMLRSVEDVAQEKGSYYASVQKIGKEADSLFKTIVIDFDLETS